MTRLEILEHGIECIKKHMEDKIVSKGRLTKNDLRKLIELDDTSA